MNETAVVVREFVVDNFLFGDSANLEDETSFLEGGIIDSTGVLELVDFVEERFSIEIGDEDMIPENLDSVRNVAVFVTRKKQTLSETLG